MCEYYEDTEDDTLSDKEKEDLRVMELMLTPVEELTHKQKVERSTILAINACRLKYPRIAIPVYESISTTLDRHTVDRHTDWPAAQRDLAQQSKMWRQFIQECQDRLDAKESKIHGSKPQ